MNYLPYIALGGVILVFFIVILYVYTRTKHELTGKQILKIYLAGVLSGGVLIEGLIYLIRGALN